MWKQLLLPAMLCLSLPLHAEETKAPIAEKLQMGCGYSDQVYDYIAATLNQKSIASFSLHIEQGESGKRFYMYSDISWFLTLEFLSHDKNESTADDVTCIVASGDASTAPGAVDHMIITELPLQFVIGKEISEKRVSEIIQRFNPDAKPPVPDAPAKQLEWRRLTLKRP